LGIRDQIASTVFTGTEDFLGQARRILGASANFAVRRHPKIDFCGAWNAAFEKLSFCKRRSLPAFQRIEYPNRFSPSPTFWCEVAGKRNRINYGRPVNGWQLD
jgi:hypothetical protein